MKAIFYVLPLLAGIAMTFQSVINGQLKEEIQRPLLAALISFISGSIALFVVLIIYNPGMPQANILSGISWYKLTGGLLGAFIVTVTLLAVQQIGAANMFVLIVAGQLATAVALDHFGLLGMKQDPVNLQKGLGILLLIAGAYLVNKK